MDGWQLRWWKPHIPLLAGIEHSTKLLYHDFFFFRCFSKAAAIFQYVCKGKQMFKKCLLLSQWSINIWKCGINKTKWDGDKIPVFCSNPPHQKVPQAGCWAMYLNTLNNDRQQSRCSINCVTIKTSITKLIDEAKWSDSFCPPSVKNWKQQYGEICWLMVFECAGSPSQR